LQAFAYRNVGDIVEVERLPLYNPVAHPEPDFQFDQRSGG